MQTRCKFQCVSVTQIADRSKSVVMTPVTGNSDENKSFWKWTPSGKFELNCVNPNVVFEPGKSYFIDVTLAE